MAKAEEDIKKVFVFKDQLNKVNEDNKHHLRFRIVTDDLSRVSSWSPYYEVDAPDIVAVLGTAVGLSTSIMFTWEDSNGRPEYDIFIATSTNNGSTYTPYEYHGTSSTHTYSILKAAGVNRVKFIVQVASYEQKLSSTIEVYPRLNPRTYTESFAIL
jgi:hypothetical protein